MPTSIGRLFGASLILLVGGCCLPDFLNFDKHDPKPPTIPGTPGWQPPGPTPANGANGAPPPNLPPGSLNEQASAMAQKLANSEDDKRAYAARVHLLEARIKEQDKALLEARLEIQDTTAQIVKTREELQRWKQEMETVRGKLRNVERENKVTLEAIIRTLEQFLDREKETVRTPDVAVPDLPTSSKQ